METEKQKLIREIDEEEKAIEPKRKQLNSIFNDEHEMINAKLKRVYAMEDKFTPEELVFAATSLCECGAGLAYPKLTSPHGSWDCSDILLGHALKADDPGSKTHTGRLPFAFYEIKSENQPSAYDATTRLSK